MAWVASTIIGIAAVAVAASGVAYSAYSASNPPKTPKQATDGLAQNQRSLAQLQTKLAATQAAGKDPSKIQSGITKVNAAISFLTNWLTTNGNTKLGDAKAAQAVGGTPVGSPVSGIVAMQPGQTNWPLIIGGSAFAVGAGWVVVKVIKKRRKKK